MPLKVVCNDEKKSRMLRREAKKLSGDHGGIDIAGISTRPCPSCGGEVHVFILSYDKIPVSKYVSMDEKYKGEADDFFRKQRLDYPCMLLCSSCNATGKTWGDMLEEERGKNE